VGDDGGEAFETCVRGHVEVYLEIVDETEVAGGGQGEEGDGGE